MLRRLKTDVINGKALIELPAREVEIVNCDFDPEERAFYNALEDKIQLTMNKFVKDGSVMKNYTAILTLLLRLRQG
jgi:SNF2 family DNA or RNA helicase